MMGFEWEKELYIEQEEVIKILPPLVGVPAGVENYYSSLDNTLSQPVVRRKNFLTHEWSHLNKARAERPISQMNLEVKEKECLFCSGKENYTPRHLTGGDYIRIVDEKGGWKLRVFPNLYPWMIEHMNIVETPSHKVSISQLDNDEELSAWNVAVDISKELEKRKVYPMLFRNHGWGASILHYHWQIGALPYIPSKVHEELTTAKHFYRKYKINIFDAIIMGESERRLRIISENEHVLTVAAYAPRAALEVWCILKPPFSSIGEFKKEHVESLASQVNTILKRMYERCKIDTMNIVVHQLPKKFSRYYRIHVEILPFKHLAGAERGFNEYAIEVFPEKAAEMLR
jgi:galactose-1-phosphate uridylyltransferase